MQSSRLPIKVALTTALAVLIAGCAAPTAVVQEQDTPVPCPEWTKGQLGLVISVVPIAIPKDLRASEGAVPG
jgi:type IV pilus biogenesis protein CpaD/CtpE